MRECIGERTMPGVAPVDATHWVARNGCNTRVHRVSGRIGSPVKAGRTGACNEEATSGSHRSAATVRHRRDGYSPGSEAGVNSARDPRAALCAGEGHALVEMMNGEC